MPKSKNSLALLEVLRRADMKPPGSDAEESSTGQSVQSPDTQVAGTTGESSSAQVRAEGDRLMFSVSTLTLAMALFAVFVILAGAFALGKHLGFDSGWQAAADQAQMAADDEFLGLREQPPNPAVLQDLGIVTDAVNQEHVRQQRAAQVGQVGFIDGLNYVWIETFEKKSAAPAAREYLKNKDIESTLIARGSKWVLVSSEGFDYRLPEEKAACQRLVARIREIGRQYLQAGGLYNFQCYAKKKEPGSTW